MNPSSRPCPIAADPRHTALNATAGATRSNAPSAASSGVAAATRYDKLHLIFLRGIYLALIYELLPSMRAGPSSGAC